MTLICKIHQWLKAYQAQIKFLTTSLAFLMFNIETVLTNLYDMIDKKNFNAKKLH
jgi:hypothetical protein